MTSSWAVPFRWIAVAATLLAGPVSRLVAADEIPLTEHSDIRFATQEEAANTLRSQDAFTAALSPFDRQCRLQTTDPVDLATFLDFAGRQAQAWTKSEQELVTPLVHQLRAELKPFRLPLPPTILLIKTTGREESDAAYCRRQAIVLPAAYLRLPRERLQRTLTHELFHILSSHSPPLRKAMYATIGFQIQPEIALPAALRDRKLTNPDAPAIEAVIEVILEDGPRMVTPVLFSSTAHYDPQRGRRLFDYLVFRLMVLQPSENGWTAALEGDQPRLLDPVHVPSYHEKIGRNTGYIIHPDEILADNFVHLVANTEHLPTPQIVDRLRNLLQPSGEAPR